MGRWADEQTGGQGAWLAGATVREHARAGARSTSAYLNTEGPEAIVVSLVSLVSRNRC